MAFLLRQLWAGRKEAGNERVVRGRLYGHVVQDQVGDRFRQHARAPARANHAGAPDDASARGVLTSAEGLQGQEDPFLGACLAEGPNLASRAVGRVDRDQGHRGREVPIQS